MTLVSAGRVGKPHGRDGAFHVEAPDHPLDEGTEVLVGDRRLRVDRRAGTDVRPLVRLAGVEDPRPLRGQTLLVEAELADDEWLAGDLLGCEVEGLGRVQRVLNGPSCSVLEVESGRLVPLVSDAVRLVDVPGRRIEVDREFLGDA